MKHSIPALVLGAAFLLPACGSDEDDKNGDDSSGELKLENVRKVLETNADIALAAYGDTVTTAEALKIAIEAFKAEPTEQTFAAAKMAWLVAREPYGQTEVYRFRNSPIDSTDYESEDGPEGDINAWPLGEALIDYVSVNESDFGDDQVGVTEHSTPVNGGDGIDAEFAEANPEENIIGNTDIEINEDLISETATADDEHDVIAGYHAIEFLLWGQDLNDDAGVTDGTDRDAAVKTYGAPNVAAGGQRPLSDFTDSPVAARRFQYLLVATDKLIADLKQVEAGWEDGAKYRSAFTTIETLDDAKQKLSEILSGMGTLSEGELAGERMQIAFSANSQEDEQSCFSDNTHRDIWLDAEGISNSFFGVYAGYDSTLDGSDDEDTSAVDGYGINDLLADEGLHDLADKLKSALATTEAAYKSIDAKARDGKPFDVLIQSTDSSEVTDTIIALSEQSAIITEVAEALGLGTVVDPAASECDTTDPAAECP